MEHLLPTMKEKEESAKLQLSAQRRKARKDMRSKFEDANPPMNEGEKQRALSDRMQLIRTMETAHNMIETKFQPKGTA